jgi:ferredoxin
MNKDCCTACGRCVRRCPFDAFTTDYPKKSQSQVLSRYRHQQPTISFNVDLCRGCGLCSTVCKDGSIPGSRLRLLILQTSRRRNSPPITIITCFLFPIQRIFYPF